MAYRSKIKNGAARQAAPFTQIVFVTPTVFFKPVLWANLLYFNRFIHSVIYCFLGDFNSGAIKTRNHWKVLPKFYPFSLYL